MQTSATMHSIGTLVSATPQGGGIHHMHTLTRALLHSPRAPLKYTCDTRQHVRAQAASTTRVSDVPGIATNPAVVTVLHNATARGQSPVWDARTQTLYCTDVEDHKVPFCWV